MKTNWPKKRRDSLSKAERDHLSIQRDALLRKKRLLDAIDKLQQNAPKNQKVFETDCNYLVNATGIDNPTRLNELLSLISTSTISFKIFDEGSEFFWRDDPVEITIKNGFNNYSKKIREEYHQLNDLLQKEEHRPNYWQITNPFWLLIQIFRLIFSFAKHHKIASIIALITSVLLVILRFLELDYSVIFRNFLLVKEFIISIL